MGQICTSYLLNRGANMLYFDFHKTSGYNLQMIINLKEKTIKRGYCLGIFKDWITLNKKTFEAIYSEFIKAGFQKVED